MPNRVRFVGRLACSMLLVGSAAACARGADDTIDPSRPAVPSSAPTTNLDPTTDTSAALEGGELLLAFGDAWGDGDWERLGTLATPDVVATARSWSTDGGRPGITPDTVGAIIDDCAETAAVTSCEFLFVPSAGRGLIFTVVFGPQGPDLVVSDLVFGGDAG